MANHASRAHVLDAIDKLCRQNPFGRLFRAGPEMERGEGGEGEATSEWKNCSFA